MFSLSLLDVMMPLGDIEEGSSPEVRTAQRGLSEACKGRREVRWGIPDHWLVAGLSSFEVIIAQWQWMPQVVPSEKGFFESIVSYYSLLGSIRSSHGSLLYIMLALLLRNGEAEI